MQTKTKTYINTWTQKVNEAMFTISEYAFLLST